MEIKRTIKCCFQNKNEEVEILELERGSNWHYEIELMNALDTPKLADFLHYVEELGVKWSINYEPIDSNWTSFRLVLTFVNEGDR